MKPENETHAHQRPARDRRSRHHPDRRRPALRDVEVGHGQHRRYLDARRAGAARADDAARRAVRDVPARRFPGRHVERRGRARRDRRPRRRPAGRPGASARWSPCSTCATPRARPRSRRLKVPGEIADSRVVGNVLYVASYENAACYGCGDRAAHDGHDVRHRRLRPRSRWSSRSSFESNARGTDNVVWGPNWKRSIFVTEQAPLRRRPRGCRPEPGRNRQTKASSTSSTSAIPMAAWRSARASIVAGAILSRWQLDERDGRAPGASASAASGRVVNGVGAPEVDTFRVESTQSFVPLGHMTHAAAAPGGPARGALRRQPRLRHHVTPRTDPLFVIDLADPAAPAPARRAGDTGLHVPPGAARRPHHRRSASTAPTRTAASTSRCSTSPTPTGRACCRASPSPRRTSTRTTRS